MKRKIPPTSWLCCLLSAIASPLVMASPFEFEAPRQSRDDLFPAIRSIEAPRGQILDRKGRPLASNYLAGIITYPCPLSAVEQPEQFAQQLRAHLESLPETLREACKLPTQHELTKHLENRAPEPLTISSPLDAEDSDAIFTLALEADLGIKWVVLRDYPQGDTGAHLIGHLKGDFIPGQGAPQEGEPDWRTYSGAVGLEQSFQKRLSGKAGLIMRLFDEEGAEVETNTIRKPIPGHNLVLTIDLSLQEIVDSELARRGLPGAAILMNAHNGDLLAMASYPTFSPSAFVPWIGADDFDELAKDQRDPLYHRAVSASYPPGSVFKPLVALAALESGAITPYERIYCEPSLTIEGRTFRNWSDSDEGMASIEEGLVRSCNTFFYQAAISTGARPILNKASEYGLGRQPDVPLRNVARGRLPIDAASPGAIANLSIGQGEVLASPLQVVTMMAGLCRGKRLPEPRLVSRIQSQDFDVLEAVDAKAVSLPDGHEQNHHHVQRALYRVVNHERGTGSSARLDHLPISGKTGTSQWRHDGKEGTVAWFAGYVHDSNPPLAFVVAFEEDKGSSISGGSTAAPVARRILSRAFQTETQSILRASERSANVPLYRYPLFAKVEPIKAIPVDEFHPHNQPVSRRASQPIRAIPVENEQASLNKLDRFTR
ncbi:MAG: penicillin-binding transpeptidase domain-containing protein [Verrucomicrobiota bacterium JB023]|nr:penicillin-binding transpeptidase domain-containing protein [Verrucomicrobiota bacterium JB023]